LDATSTGDAGQSYRCSPCAFAIMQSVTGQLTPSSCKTFTLDVKHFAQWMAGWNLPFWHLVVMHQDFSSRL